METEKYDSAVDTLKHIKRVNQLLTQAAAELIRRANCHDNSKLESPEKELFDEYTPKLAKCTYGSDEYKQFLKDLKVGLDHHYKHNSHHPEHYRKGVNDFDLFDLIEMLFDWKAATERHNDGSITKSIDINKDRFKISDQICDIFRNTASRYLHSHNTIFTRETFVENKCEHSRTSSWGRLVSCLDCPEEWIED